MDRLRGYGYPVETQPGPGGYYRLASGRAMPPLLLDDDEAVATLLGLAILGSAGGTPAASPGDAVDSRAGSGGPGLAVFGHVERLAVSGWAVA